MQDESCVLRCRTQGPKSFHLSETCGPAVVMRASARGRQTRAGKMKQWNIQSEDRLRRIAAGSTFAQGKAVDANRLVEFLSVVIRPGDRACLEGNNQKQADVLAGALA